MAEYVNRDWWLSHRFLMRMAYAEGSPGLENFLKLQEAPHRVRLKMAIDAPGDNPEAKSWHELRTRRFLPGTEFDSYGVHSPAWGDDIAVKWTGPNGEVWRGSIPPNFLEIIR